MTLTPFLPCAVERSRTLRQSTAVRVIFHMVGVRLFPLDLNLFCKTSQVCNPPASGRCVSLVCPLSLYIQLSVFCFIEGKLKQYVTKYKLKKKQRRNFNIVLGKELRTCVSSLCYHFGISHYLSVFRKLTKSVLFLL